MENINFNIIIFFISVNILIFTLVNNYKKNFLKFLIDTPDKKRKLHDKPTFIIGGVFVAIYLLIYLAFSIFLKIDYLPIIIVVSLAIFLSVFMMIVLKLIHTKNYFLFLIILFAVFFEEKLLIKDLYFSTFDKNFYLGNFSYFITILCMLLLINSLNLSDGINGLAVGISLIWIIYLILINDNEILNFNTAFGLLLILFFNILKGNFLGDNGALVLSGLIGLLIIYSYNNLLSYENLRISAEEIVILLIIPGIDIFRLFVVRIYNKNNPFSADRNHLHHLLIKKFSLKLTLLIYLTLILIFIIVNSLSLINELILIIGIILIYFKLFFYLKKN